MSYYAGAEHSFLRLSFVGGVGASVLKSKKTKVQTERQKIKNNYSLSIGRFNKQAKAYLVIRRQIR